MTSWLHRKQDLIRKIRLTLKFMTSHLINKQIQYTYYPISQKVKATRTRNLVEYLEYNKRLIKYNKRSIFLEKFSRK